MKNSCEEKKNIIKEKKPVSVKSSIKCIIIFSLLAVLWFYINRDIIFDNSTDFYELEASDEGIRKSEFVSLDVKYVLGNYAETKHYSGFIPTGKDQHYILWLENGEIISLKISNKNQINQLNQLYGDTLEYLDAVNESKSDIPLTEKITVKGPIHTIEPKIEDYYVQTLNQIGISDKNHTIYYVEIDASMSRTRAISYLSIILVFVAFSTLRLVKTLRKKLISD